MSQSHHKAFWIAAIIAALMLLICACGPDYTVIGDITPDPSAESPENSPSASSDPDLIHDDAEATDGETPMDSEETEPGVSVVDGGGSSAGGSTEGTYTPGTYVGQADGYSGLVTVEVTVDSTSIVEIVVTDQLENSDITAVRDAIIDLPNTILSERSLDVDVVSGATTTSNAIIDAISFALELAAA